MSAVCPFENLAARVVDAVLADLPVPKDAAAPRNIDGGAPVPTPTPPPPSPPPIVGRAPTVGIGLAMVALGFGVALIVLYRRRFTANNKTSSSNAITNSVPIAH